MLWRAVLTGKACNGEPTVGTFDNRKLKNQNNLRHSPGSRAETGSARLSPGNKKPPDEVGGVIGVPNRRISSGSSGIILDDERGLALNGNLFPLRNFPDPNAAGILVQLEIGGRTRHFEGNGEGSQIAALLG